MRRLASGRAAILELQQSMGNEVREYFEIEADGSFSTDVLVLMAPLTADTRHVIGARALAMLPPGAWLINVARGALVDEGALLAALDTGPLAGATLDVFAHEPLPAAHAFWQHPKIRLTPHVAAQTLIDPSARQVADKIRRLLQRESVSGLVDRQRGY